MKKRIKTHLSCNYVCVWQLVLTVGLLAVVVYLYTVLAFNFFRKFYNKSDDKDTRDMKCNDMLTVSYIYILTHTYTCTGMVVECLSTCIPSLSSVSINVYLSRKKTQPHTSFIYLLRLRGVEEDSESDPCCWSESCLLSSQQLFIKMMDTWIQPSS